MKSSAKKIELASVDDLFSTEESRADAQRERVLEIPLSELHPFKNHPFKVKDDEAMLETADSIKQYEGIAEVQASGGERFTVKQLERTRKSLEARLEKLQAEGRKDDVVTFEQLGVDRLFVDEAHNYKNRAKRCRTR